MTKPITPVSWATDALYTADADPWAGAANKLDPGAARRAEGAEPDTFPAEWFNFMANSWGAHLDYLENGVPGGFGGISTEANTTQVLGAGTSTLGTWNANLPSDAAGVVTPVNGSGLLRFSEPGVYEVHFKIQASNSTTSPSDFLFQLNSTVSGTHPSAEAFFDVDSGDVSPGTGFSSIVQITLASEELSILVVGAVLDTLGVASASFWAKGLA